MKRMRPAFGSLWIVSPIKQVPMCEKRMRPAFGNRICKPDQVGTYVKKKGETRFWQLVDRKPNQVGIYV